MILMCFAAEMCRVFLSQQWHTLQGLPESGSVYNHQIDSLVKTYFTNVTYVLSVVEATAKWVENEVQMLQSKDSCLHTFPTINK
jgi:cytochrome c oxidase assembly factor CtaG